MSDDLAALRVPMRPLRGAGDLLGLSVYHLSQRFPFAEWAVVVGDCTDGTLLLVNVHDAEAAIVHVVRPGEGDDLCVTTADASTRDRLAWWCAGRLDMRLQTNAPSLHVWSAGTNRTPTLKCAGAVLTTSGAGWKDNRAFFSHEPEVWERDLMGRGPAVVALAELDPDDPRLLPDGSRYVDALAWVAIARHLGGDRG